MSTNQKISISKLVDLICKIVNYELIIKFDSKMPDGALGKLLVLIKSAGLDGIMKLTLKLELKALINGI